MAIVGWWNAVNVSTTSSIASVSTPTPLAVVAVVVARRVRCTALASAHSTARFMVPTLVGQYALESVTRDVDSSVDIVGVWESKASVVVLLHIDSI